MSNNMFQLIARSGRSVLLEASWCLSQTTLLAEDSGPSFCWLGDFKDTSKGRTVKAGVAPVHPLLAASKMPPHAGAKAEWRENDSTTERSSSNVQAVQVRNKLLDLKIANLAFSDFSWRRRRLSRN